MVTKLLFIQGILLYYPHMATLKQALLTLIKSIQRGVRPPHTQERFLNQNVPYFSQWESPELVASILSKEILAVDDPRWKESGARTQEEYTTWSWSGCGMACTKMLLAAHLGQTVPLVTLGRKCSEYGGYPSMELGSAGLHYKPYVTFLKSEYGIAAKIVSPLLLTEITEAISGGNFVIVSVSPQIRDPSSTPTSKGGHLVLIVGYDLTKKVIYLHNPSGIDKKTQAYAEVSFDDFKKFFSGRGIVIKRKKN